MKLWHRIILHQNRLSCSTESNTKPPDSIALTPPFWQERVLRHMKLRYLGGSGDGSIKETDLFSVPLKHPLNNNLWVTSSLSFAFQCTTTCPCRHGIFFTDWTKVNLNLAQRSRNRGVKQKGTKEHKKDQKATPIWCKLQIISTAALPLEQSTN